MRETFKIHATYIIGILLASNIVLVTVRWGGIPDLVTYLTFALTVTSLVLAVLAIVYAYLSNASVGQQVLILRTSTDALAGVAESVSKSAAAFDERLASIPKLFEDVGLKVTETHHFVHELYESSGKKSADAAVASPDNIETPLTISGRILAFSSLSGLRALYVASLAHSRRIAFNLDDLTKRVQLERPYFQAFLIACDCCGVLDTIVNEGVWNVVSFDKELENGLRNVLIEREKAENEEWALSLGVDRTFERIEAYFAGSELPADGPVPPRQT